MFINGIVERVALTSLNICVAEVIRSYGVPYEVNRIDGHFIELLYPNEGLIFFVNTVQSPNVETVFLTTRQLVEQFAETETKVEWDVVKENFPEKCPSSGDKLTDEA